MADLENVIQDLQSIKTYIASQAAEATKDGNELARKGLVESQKVIDKAIAMLKEQEERIGVLTRALEQMPKPTKLLDVYGDGYAKVVHCKNCKYCEYPDAEKEWCKKGHLHRNAETWFCADGERR